MAANGTQIPGGKPLSTQPPSYTQQTSQIPKEGVPLGIPATGPSRLAEVRYYFPYLKPVSAWVALLVLSGLAVNLFRAPVSLVPMEMTEHYEDTNYLYRFLAAVVGLIALSGLATVVRGYCAVRIGEHLLHAIRRDLFNKLERLSMASIHTQGSGPFTQRLARDVYAVQDLFNQTSIQIVDESFRFVVCGALCLWLDPGPTLAMLALFFVVWPIVRLVNNKVERLAKRMVQLSEESLSNLTESVGGFREILASGSFGRFAERFSSLLKRSESYGVRTGFWEQIAIVLPRTWISLLLILPYMLVVGRLDSREDIGRVVTYVLLIQQMLPVFGMLAQASSKVARATPSLRAIRELLEREPESVAVTAGAEIEAYAPPEIRSIRFENVSLDLGGRRILEDIDLDISGGKMTAVIGESGAGKTTLFHLMLGLIEPTRGRVTIDGVPVLEIPKQRMRELLGFIPQDPFIFNRSLEDNLLGAEAEGERSDEEVLRALEAAQLDSLVESRENEGGLSAHAGYMGSRLSSGERQRIALARLILQDPRAVVCDEYTANLDIKTATLIHETMRTLFADRTRILISHELYTIKGADHIIVLERGRVVQAGTHGELLEHDGLYKTLWDMQRLS